MAKLARSAWCQVFEGELTLTFSALLVCWCSLLEPKKSRRKGGGGGLISNYNETFGAPSNKVTNMGHANVLSTVFGNSRRQLIIDSTLHYRCFITCDALYPLVSLDNFAWYNFEQVQQPLSHFGPILFAECAPKPLCSKELCDAAPTAIKPAF